MPAMNHQPSTMPTDLEELPLFAAAEERLGNPFARALQEGCMGAIRDSKAEISDRLRAALAELAANHLGEETAIMGDELAVIAGYRGTPGCSARRGKRVVRYRRWRSCARARP